MCWRQTVGAKWGREVDFFAERVGWSLRLPAHGARERAQGGGGERRRRCTDERPARARTASTATPYSLPPSPIACTMYLGAKAPGVEAHHVDRVGAVKQQGRALLVEADVGQPLLCAEGHGVPRGVLEPQRAELGGGRGAGRRRSGEVAGAGVDELVVGRDGHDVAVPRRDGEQIEPLGRPDP